MASTRATFNATERRFDTARQCWYYEVVSPFLRGTNRLEILLPDDYRPGRACRLLFILPVEPGTGSQYGDGLLAIQRLNIHNTADLIGVHPTFPITPWYGDHPADPLIRLDSYLCHVVVPLIDREYGAPRQADDRLLIGYSKSGWGALALLLRHPDLFGYAASWDAPLLLDYRPIWGILENLGDADNFARYQPLRLLQNAPPAIRQRCRFAILGSQSFGPHPGNEFAATPHTSTLHQRLVNWGIPHHYNNDVAADHHWDGAWLPVAIDALLAISQPTAGDTTVSGPIDSP